MGIAKPLRVTANMDSVRRRAEYASSLLRAACRTIDRYPVRRITVEGLVGGTPKLTGLVAG